MVQLIVTVFVFVMALAFPAAAQTTQQATVPATSTEVEEPPDGPENETVEEKLARLKDWRDGRKARMQRMAQEQIPVVLDSDKQNGILADSIVMEVEDANESAEKKVSKYDTPSMRKVRKEREEVAKRERELRKYNFESKRDTGLRCQNQQDYDNVYIHPESAGRYMIRSHSMFTITNSTDIPVDILYASGGEDTVAVERLCPGGMITLQRVLDTFRVGDVMQVSYTAYAPGVELVQPVSPVVSIWACRTGIGGSCPKEFVGRWNIRSYSKGANPVGGMSPQQQQLRAPQERLKDLKPKPQ